MKPASIRSRPILHRSTPLPHRDSCPSPPVILAKGFEILSELDESKTGVESNGKRILLIFDVSASVLNKAEAGAPASPRFRRRPRRSPNEGRWSRQAGQLVDQDLRWIERQKLINRSIRILGSSGSASAAGRRLCSFSVKLGFGAMPSKKLPVHFALALPRGKPNVFACATSKSGLPICASRTRRLAEGCQDLLRRDRIQRSIFHCSVRIQESSSSAFLSCFAIFLRARKPVAATQRLGVRSFFITLSLIGAAAGNRRVTNK